MLNSIQISFKSGTQRARKCAAVFLSLQLFCCSSAFAVEPVDDERQIDAITNQILHKEIDLERYYLQYRIYGTKIPKTQRIRFAAGQIASAAAGLASSIWLVKISGANIHHPEKITDGENRRAIRVGIIAILLDGASVGLEFGSNGWTAMKNVILKKSPGAAVKEVIKRVQEIDALRAERDALVAKFPDSDLGGVYRAEGRVLKHFRDWCLSEFADVYSDIKALQSSYNVYYALDLAADGLYLASYLLALKSYDSDRFTKPSVVTGIVGDGFGIASAPASSRSYYLLAKFWRNRLKKKFQESLKDAEADAKVAMAELNKELATKDISVLEQSPSVQNRTSAYALWSARYDKSIDDSLEDLRHNNKVALQGELTGPLISGTYLNQDILGMVTLSGRLRNRDRAQNNLNLAGAIGSTAGTGLSLGLTTYWLLDDIRHRRKMRKKEELPEQILAKRLKTLDELDSMLISSSKPQFFQ